MDFEFAGCSENIYEKNKFFDRIQIQGVKNNDCFLSSVMFSIYVYLVFFFLSLNRLKCFVLHDRIHNNIYHECKNAGIFYIFFNDYSPFESIVNFLKLWS